MYNLLLVDDEPIIRRGIKSMTILSDIGIEKTFEASNVDSVFEILSKERMDIVFLDINMPDMDGLTLAGKIKSSYPKIGIVMITGYDYFEYMQRAIRIGVDDYLLKPVNKLDIEQVLKRVMSKLREMNINEKMKNLLNEASESSNDRDEFNMVCAYTKENMFHIEFSLGKMAQELGFHSNYLSSLFKRIYGIPFQEYIGIKRMEQAKLLLLSKDIKNFEIAQAIGYDDVNYFITKFKKTYGISPKQFRLAVLNNEI